MGGSHTSGSGRARRESATRAMQGWHSQRLLGNGEIADPIIKVLVVFKGHKQSLFCCIITSLFFPQDKGTIVLKKDKTPKSSGTFSALSSIKLPLVPSLLNTNSWICVGSAKRKRTPSLEDDRVMPYKSDKLQ